MGKKDKKLDNLLRNQELDKPSLDFTEDIMQMITCESLARETEFATIVTKSSERSPMHMTDYVMDHIQNPIRKTYSLLTPKEIIIASIILVLTSLIVLIASPLITPSFDPSFIANGLVEFIKIIPQTGAILLIIGTALWILDQFVRSKLIKNKST